jgi:hypothetical protein
LKDNGGPDKTHTPEEHGKKDPNVGYYRFLGAHEGERSIKMANLTIFFF